MVTVVVAGLATFAAPASAGGAPSAPTANPGPLNVSITDGAGNANATFAINQTSGTVNVTNGTVTDVGVGSLPNLPENTTKAINFAIGNATTANDTVVVGDGTYNGTEAVNVSNDAVTSIDNTANATTVDGFGAQEAVFVNATGVSITALDSVTNATEGFEIGAGGTNSALTTNTVESVTDNATVVRADGVNLNNHIVRNVGGDGVFADGVSNLDVFNFASFDGVDNAVFATSGTSDNVTVQNVDINDTSSTAISLTLTDDAVLTGNTLTNVSGARAISVSGLSGNVSDNRIRDSTIGNFVIQANSQEVSSNNIDVSSGAEGIVYSGGGNLTDNIVNGTGSNGIRVNGAFASVVNNTVTNVGANGTVVQADNVGLTNNTITTAGDAGVFVDAASNVDITGGTIDGTSSAGITAVSPADTNVLVDGVTVNDTSRTGVALFSDDSVVRNSRISNTTPFNDGINAGSNNISLRDNILRDIDGVGIRGGSNVTGNDINATVDTGIRVTVPGANVTGNTVANTSDGANGTLVAADNVDLVDNTITDPGASGIFADSLTNLNVTNATVRRASVDGVNLTNVSQVDVNDSRIVASDDNGIVMPNVGPSDNVTIARNRVIDTVSFNGINLDSVSDATVVSNNVSNNSFNGIRTSGVGGSVVIDNNTLLGNNNDGISSGVSDNTIVNNTIRNNNAGVSAANDVLTNNTITGNDFDGVDVTLAAGNVVVNGSDTNVSANGRDGVRVDTTGTSISVADGTVRDNGVWDLNVLSDTEVTVTGIDIGASTAANTNIDAVADNAALTSVDTAPADPVGQQNISRYVNATNTSASGSFLDLTFNYNDTDVPLSLNESTLEVWRNNSTAWAKLGADSLDTGANTVRYNISQSEFASTFAPLVSTTSVSGCRVISSSGSYTLANDITNSTTLNCIEIEASDVVFDGQNNFIDGVDNDTDSVGINVSSTGTLTNVTVRNVNLTGWGDEFGRGGAITVSETDASNGVNLISDVNITRSGGAIDISPDSNPTTGVNVTNSVITNTGANSNSIELGDTPQVNITDNVFRNSGAAVVRIGTSGNLTFVNNTFGPTGAEGIVLFPASDDEVTFRNDRFIDVAGPDIDDSQPVGPSGTNVTFSNTTAGVNATVDFDVEGINTIDAPSSVPSDPPNDANVNEYLNVTNDSFVSPTYLNVTFDYDSANVPADADESTLAVDKYNGTWNENFGVTFRDLDTTAQEVTVNATEVGSTFAPLAFTGYNNVSSCVTVNASTRPSDGLTNLTSSIDTPLGSCINVTVGNVTFEGQGNTINSTASPTVAGVNVTNASAASPAGEPSNVTVRNVNVTNWDNGVRYLGADDGNVTNVNSTSNDDGIVVDNSDGASITGNEVIGSGTFGILHRSSVGGNLSSNNVSNGIIGISLDTGSNSNEIRNNDLLGNANDGINLLGVGSNNLTNNTVTGNGQGIYVQSTSGDNNVTGNNASANSGDGIRIESDSNNVSDNEVTANTGNGVRISSGDGNVLLANNISESGQNGTLVNNSTNVTLENNDIIGSGDRGVSLVDASDFTITGGSINSTSANAIRTEGASSSDNLTIQDVTVNASGTGFKIFRADDTVIRRNTLTNVFGFGIDSAGTDVGDNVTIRENTLRDISSDAMDIGGPGTEIVANDIDGATGSGIDFQDRFGSGATIADNVVNDTASSVFADAAIQIDESDVNVTNNTVTNSAENGTLITSTADNANLTNNSIEGVSGDGVLVDGAIGVTLTNTTVRGASVWAFEAVNGGEATATNFDVGPSTAPNTAYDFEASDAALNNQTSPPADPANWENISRFVNATNTSASGYLNITFNYNESDATGLSQSTLDVWRLDDNTQFPGTTVNTTSNEVQYNLSGTDLGSTYAPLANLNALDSCRTIDESNAPSSGFVSLTSNITDSTAPSCINITVSNITFDGQGNRIDGVSGAGTVGINVTNASGALTNVRVENVNVTEWADGVRYNDSNGTVDSVEASDVGVGVNLTDSPDTFVQNSEMRRATTAGIVAPSAGQTLFNNTVSDADFGISVNGPGNTVMSNEVTNSNFSIAVVSNDSGYTDNRVAGGGTGFLVLNAFGNSFDNNLAESNTFGVSVSGNSSNNTFTADTSRNNSVEFEAEDNATSNTVDSLDIGNSTAANTTLSFVGERVQISSNTTPPEANKENISRYVEANSTAPSGSFLNLTFEYTDADVADIAESSLVTSRYNATAGLWEEVNGSRLNETANEVGANITSFSLFAPLGETVGCIERRSVGRGEEDLQCPTDRTLSRGETRRELDRRSGRERDEGTSRRDNGRTGSRSRSR